MTFWKILFLSILIPATLSAQEYTFSADRPGVTGGTDVMPMRKLQWETGVGYEHYKDDFLSQDLWTLNTSLFRYGLTKFAELRVHGDVFNSSLGTWGDVGIGSKIKLFDGKGIVPAIAMLGNVDIPIGSEFDDDVKEVGGDLHLVFQNDITSELCLSYDGGIEWATNGSGSSYFLGVCLSHQTTDRLGFFVEEFNYFNDDTNSWIGAGVTYMATDKLQIDIETDINLNQPSDHVIVSLGAAWCIN